MTQRRAKLSAAARSRQPVPPRAPTFWARVGCLLIDRLPAFTLLRRRLNHHLARLTRAKRGIRRPDARLAATRGLSIPTNPQRPRHFLREIRRTTTQAAAKMENYQKLEKIGEGRLYHLMLGDKEGMSYARRAFQLTLPSPTQAPTASSTKPATSRPRTTASSR